jgi:hypothetical protein
VLLARDERREVARRIGDLESAEKAVEAMAYQLGEREGREALERAEAFVTLARKHLEDGGGP